MKLKAKDIGKIESWIKTDNKWVLKAIAILFKREDLSNTEHYTDAHINHKMELFKDLLIKDFIFYILYIQDKLIKKIKILSE